MNSFFLLFIGLPVLEIFLMIKIGNKVGALNTIALIFLTAIIGVYFAKIQGLQTLRSGMVNLYQNKLPAYEILTGASIAIAALLLIIPGFITDFIGFMLLMPFTRKIIFKAALRKKNNDNNIKKLNFNIPKPENFFLLSKNISNYKINIDITSAQIKQNIIEIQTSLFLNPIKDGFENIDTKIIYSTIIELENNQISKDEMEKLILIKIPTKIYPELRQIFIFLFENSGFKDVKISESVDFEKLYKLRRTQ